MLTSKRWDRLSALPIMCGALLALLSCQSLEGGHKRSALPHYEPVDSVAEHMAATPINAYDPPEKNAPPPGPLSLTLSEAVLLSLENNAALVVQRLASPIKKTFEDQERAAFDPTAAMSLSTGKKTERRPDDGGASMESVTTDRAEGVIFLKRYFPTGATVTLQAEGYMDQNFFATRLGMTVTQALLKGFGPDANLARLREAVLDTRMSAYALRGFTELLVAEVEHAYWDYALSQREIEIVEHSLNIARQQLEETRALIAVGRLAKAELAAVQAEVAAQEQALIEARAQKATLRIHLLRLLNPPEPVAWEHDVELIHQPVMPEVQLETVDRHVAVSKRMRPIINEARLKVLRGDLEIVRTRNGLLPLLDLFITFGKSGYADSFGDAAGNIGQDSYDALAGVTFSHPFHNREAKARHQRSLLEKAQAQKALENLLQLVEVDVRKAHIEVQRTRQQITASSATRAFDEEKLRTETEKLRVGKSTSFLVAQAQRDLLATRIAEVSALTNYLKALIDLYRHDGSLLVRRGISAPGKDPANDGANHHPHP